MRIFPSPVIDLRIESIDWRIERLL